MVKHTIIVRGSSDDLICLNGFISDEFSPKNTDDRSILRFNDGTVLAIWYDDEGCWRIRTLTVGPNTAFTHVPAEGPDTHNYSDIVTLHGPIVNVQFIDNK